MADKGRRQFTAFHDLYNLRRSSEVSVSTFVAEFEHTYFKFSKQGMTLPDAVMAFMLLAASCLNENERKLVISAMKEVSYAAMKSALKRNFSNEIAKNLMVDSNEVSVKHESVL